MDNLIKTINHAVDNKDYTTLKLIFSNSNTTNNKTISWQSVGTGEQRSIAAYLLVKIVTVSNNEFLNTLFGTSTATTTTTNATSVDDMIVVLTTSLGHLPTIVDYGADNTIRETLFQYYVSNEEYILAARILSTIRMEDNNNNNNNNSNNNSNSNNNNNSSDDANSTNDGMILSNSNNNNSNTNVYYYTPAKKADVYVRIAECYLAADEASDAEAAVNRAGIIIEQQNNNNKLLVANGQDNTNPNTTYDTNNDINNNDYSLLVLRYKSTFVRILDNNRKFIQASIRYYELSQLSLSNTTNTTINIIDDDDILQMLGRAVTCIILSSSTNQQRSRIINTIMNDSRIYQLDTISEFCYHTSILYKMYTNQIINYQSYEIQQFENNLNDHQKAIRGDGMTIVQRSIIEHNILAISILYESIYLSELAYVLIGGTGTENNSTALSSMKQAEQIVSTMIVDGTLKNAYIDQVNSLLLFSTGTSTSNTTENTTDNWDKSITSFLLQLNDVTESIKAL